MEILNKIVLSLKKDELINNLTQAMQKEGYGILTNVDVSKALKTRLNINIPSTIIIGTNNPNIAKELFELDYRVGVFLPFSILIREVDNEKTELSLVNPVKLLSPLNNSKIDKVANKVNMSFLNIIESLSKNNNGAYQKQKNNSINIHRVVRLMGGSVILTGLLLGHYIDERWLWLSAFAGANLFITAILGDKFCGPIFIYDR